MRTVSSGRAAALRALEQAHHFRFEVQNVDGSWIDLSAWVMVGTTLDFERVDMPVDVLRVMLRRDDSDDGSLAPLVEDGKLNVDDADAYAALLDAGASCRAAVSVVERGDATDYVPIFAGRVYRMDWGQPTAVATCNSEDSDLQDAQIEEVRTYGPGDLESILQAILDDWSPIAGLTLYTPVSPGITRAALEIPQKGLLAALRDMALEIGWEVRFRRDASDVSRLTLFDPGRERDTADDTIGPDDYSDVQDLGMGLADVRNVCAITYAGGTVTRTSTESLAKYPRRFIAITEDATSNIDTLEEAEALGDAVLHDLGLPMVEQAVLLEYPYWPAQFTDLIAFEQNGVHYTDDQLLAVTGLRMTLAAPGHIQTAVMTRGAVAGAYRTWIARGVVRRPVTDGSSSLLDGVPWAAVSERPTTIAGYGITDVYSKTASDARYAAASHTHPWSDIFATPTTRAGYGITDVPKTDGTDATGTWGIDISGTAAKATKLATARNINGVAFDGSADVTVPAAAGTLTGPTLASGVTASSLTSVGPLTSLTVSGRATFTTGFSNGFRIFDGSSGRWAGGQAVLVAGDSSADVQIASFNYGLNIITNTTTGATAVVLVGYGDVVSIVAQLAGTAGTEFVTGAPAAGQTQLKMSSGLTYIRSGSSRHGNTYGPITLTGANA